MTILGGDVVMDEQAKDEVLAAYAAYVTAFRANDIQAIDKLMQYPLAHIGNDQTTLLDAYPIKPAEMRAAKQWHDTRDIAHEVVFASADKAHLILRQATRVRADGSPIDHAPGASRVRFTPKMARPKGSPSGRLVRAAMRETSSAGKPGGNPRGAASAALIAVGLVISGISPSPLSEPGRASEAVPASHCIPLNASSSASLRGQAGRDQQR